LGESEEGGERVPVGVLAVLALEGRYALIAEGQAGVQGDVVPPAPGGRRFGLTAEAIAFGLLGGGKANIAVSGDFGLPCHDYLYGVEGLHQGISWVSSL